MPSPITHNDIIVEGITNDFVTLNITYTGFYGEYGGAWFSDCYEFRVKNSKNQTVSVTFDCFEWDSVANRRWWNVILNVYNKRKVGFQPLIQTGKAGIESLILTKKIVKHFIEHFYEYVNGRSYNIDDKIFVWWDDNRRRDIYYRYLADLGFVESNINISNKHWKSGKCLVKAIEHNGT